MANRSFGIFGQQSFQLGFRALMLQESLSGSAENSGELRPGIRSTHVDNPYRLNSGFRWLYSEQARGLAAFDTAPELPFSRNDEVLIEWVGMGSDLDPFAAASDY